MSDFTFLTEEQCFGDNKLDILEKRGTKAAGSNRFFYSFRYGCFLPSSYR